MIENWILARKKSIGLYSLIFWDPSSTAVSSAIFVPQQWRDLQQYRSVRNPPIKVKPAGGGGGGGGGRA